MLNYSSAHDHGNIIVNSKLLVSLPGGGGGGGGGGVQK